MTELQHPGVHDPLVETARLEGLLRVVLKPTEKSVSLYKRHGFTDAHGLLALRLVAGVR